MAITKEYDPERDGPKRPVRPRPPMTGRPVPGKPRPVRPAPTDKMYRPDRDGPKIPSPMPMLNRPFPKPQPLPKMPKLDSKSARGNAIMDRLK